MKPLRPSVKPLSRIKHLHFVGIGGAGMGGIAEVLLNQGFKITGSDIHKSTITECLKSQGAEIFYQHNANNIQGADAVV